jgi:hypothetical protein
LSSDLEAIQPGKADVQQDQIRSQFFCFPNSIQSIGRDADDMQIRLFLKMHANKGSPKFDIIYHE